MRKTSHNDSLRSRYKNLFRRSKNLLITPKKEWESIFQEKGDFNKILTEFSLPFITIITIISFISALTTIQKPDFTIAIKSGLSEFTCYFIGLLVVYFITYKTIPGFFKSVQDSKLTAIKLTAYSSLVIYLIKILVLLIPQVYLLWIIACYTIFLVWTALPNAGKFENKDQRIVFTIILSLLLLSVPYLISVIFTKFVYYSL